MRIAFIYPYLTRISGSRGPLSIASALSSDNEVDIFTYEVKEELIENVKALIGHASFNYLNTVKKTRFGILFALKYQVLKGIDRKLYRKLQEKHLERPYDLVIVGSNEGRNLGQYIKANKGKTPVTALILMELHDHGFHMYYDRKYGTMRLLAWPLYFLVNLIERWRFSEYDLIFANSSWTATIFQYLYGFYVSGSLPTLSSETIPEITSSDGYIAVPTVSLTLDQTRMIEKLEAEGIRVKCFGPRKVESKDYLGFVSDAERLEIMANAKATLFLFDYEALGLIPLESLQVGTPVVTIPKAGPLSELRDCPDVYFAQEFEEIKSILSDIMAGPKSNEIIEECKNYAMRFAPENSARKILNEYQKFLNRHSSRIKVKN